MPELTHAEEPEAREVDCEIPNTPCHLQGVRYVPRRCASVCELMEVD